MRLKYFLLVLVLFFISFNSIFINGACTSCLNGICDNICDIGESSSCTDCYSVQCGDTYCEPGKSETCSSCSADCGKCDGDTCSIVSECKGINCASTDTNCLTGYCTHGICRSTSTFCGDTYCDVEETCKNDNCCNGVNVNFNTDENNCGNCGIQCETNKECVNGECKSIVVSTCSSGDGCKTGCSNGDLDCTCSQQSGDLCSETEICSGISLNHLETGICCSINCITQSSCTESWTYSDWSSCISGTQTRTATDTNNCKTTTNRLPLSQSCSLTSCTLNSKQCIPSNPSIYQICTSSTSGNYWKNITCSSNKICSEGICITQSTTKCSDNTEKEHCSTIKPYYCNTNLKLILNSSYCGCDSNKIIYQNTCVEPSNNQVVIPTPICQESWTCGEWGPCKDGEKTKECIDSGCNTNKFLTEPCTEITTTKQDQSVKDFNEYTNATVNLMLGKISNGIEEIIKSSKYQIIILFLIVSSIVGYTFYYLQSHKNIIKLKPKAKPEKKPVKINDLMLSVIDSLDAEERELCYTIIENEGVTQDELRNKTELTKTKMEIALTKLERRQVIRKRDGLNPRIYINDWLK